METDPIGNETHYTYDPLRNLIRETKTATAVSTYYRYDLDNRLIYTAQKAADLKLKTSISYNASGYKTSETDHFGNVTTFSVDQLGRIKKITFPKISKEERDSPLPTYSYEHDLFDHVTEVIDPYGNITSKTNTPLGDPIEIEYPDGTKELFKYDLEGSLHRHRSREGIVQIFEYDHMGRNCHIERYGRNQSQEFDAWIGSSYSEYNTFHLTEKTDKSGLTSYYEYDNAGRLISIQKERERVDLSYDPLGRVDKVKKWRSDSQYTLYTAPH